MHSFRTSLMRTDTATFSPIFGTVLSPSIAMRLNACSRRAPCRSTPIPTVSACGRYDDRVRGTRGRVYAREGSGCRALAHRLEYLEAFLREPVMPAISSVIGTVSVSNESLKGLLRRARICLHLLLPEGRHGHPQRGRISGEAVHNETVTRKKINAVDTYAFSSARSTASRTQGIHLAFPAKRY